MIGVASLDPARSRLTAAKLAFLIVLFASMAVTLLSYRQQRLQTAHELARLHAQAVEDERTILRLRQEIADRLSVPRMQMIAREHRLTEPLLGDGFQRDELALLPPGAPDAADSRLAANAGIATP